MILECVDREDVQLGDFVVDWSDVRVVTRIHSGASVERPLIWFLKGNAGDDAWAPPKQVLRKVVMRPIEEGS